MNHTIRSQAQQRKMIFTEDIKEAIQFNHAESCRIIIDNAIYSELYGDDYVCVADFSFNNVRINLDNEYFTITTNDNSIEIPLTAISNINYLYDGCCYLFFTLETLEQFYDVNLTFTHD